MAMVTIHEDHAQIHFQSNFETIYFVFLVPRVRRFTGHNLGEYWRQNRLRHPHFIWTTIN